MSDSDSEQEADPPHLARYREYKRRKEQRKLKNKPSTAAPPPPPPAPTTPFERLTNHRYTMPALKLVIWVTALLFFAHHEFGSVFFVASIPIFVWQSMEEYKRGPRELSAYSVFNENMEQLDGTFTSEQWERELRYGPGAVRKQE